MKSSLTYDRNCDEQKELSMLMKELAALITDERWHMKQAVSMEQVKDFLRGYPLLDMLLYDISGKEALDYLIELRKEYRSMHLMIIADVRMSPLEYIRPGILASSLLLRPWNRQQARTVLSEFIKDYMQNESVHERYVIESKDGVINIPYRQIFFFEARDKKVYVCAGSEEFGFRGTLEEVAGGLPDHFMRCHRSFVVNTEKIRKIDLAQNEIHLERGFRVPFARSYKAVLKEFIKNE